MSIGNNKIRSERYSLNNGGFIAISWMVNGEPGVSRYNVNEFVDSIRDKITSAVSEHQSAKDAGRKSLVDPHPARFNASAAIQESYDAAWLQPAVPSVADQIAEKLAAQNAQMAAVKAAISKKEAELSKKSADLKEDDIDCPF